MIHYSNFQVVEKISQFDWVLTADRTTTSWFGFVKKVCTVQIVTSFLPVSAECIATKDLNTNRFIQYDDNCKVTILKYLKGKE